VPVVPSALLMGRFDPDHRFWAVGSYHIISYDNLFLSIDLMLKASLHHASTRALRHSNLTDHSMNRADYLLPPLPGCDDLKQPTTNNSTQSNDISTDDKPPTPYDLYSEGEPSTLQLHSSPTKESKSSLQRLRRLPLPNPQTRLAKSPPRPHHLP